MSPWDVLFGSGLAVADTVGYTKPAFGSSSITASRIWSRSSTGSERKPAWVPVVVIYLCRFQVVENGGAMIGS